MFGKCFIVNGVLLGGNGFGSRMFGKCFIVNGVLLGGNEPQRRRGRRGKRKRKKSIKGNW